MTYMAVVYECARSVQWLISMRVDKWVFEQANDQSVVHGCRTGAFPGVVANQPRRKLDSTLKNSTTHAQPYPVDGQEATGP